MSDFNITPHFKVSEFDCSDGTPYPTFWIEPRLLPLCLALETLRVELKSSITISSGYRTSSYNRKIKGARNSQHIEGIAADIKVAGYKPKEVFEALRRLILDKKIKAGGLGLYRSWVHYDQRGRYVSWHG